MAGKRGAGERGSKPQRQDAREPLPPNSDYLLNAAEKNWPHILMLYRQFEDKKPVMLLDIQKVQIYAYPYADFLNDLNERSQIMLKDQYERAILENKMVVFVRDNERQRLVSYSMDCE